MLSEKKIRNETKNHNPPFKLNGRSLTFIYLFIYYRRQVCLLNTFQISIQTLQLQRFITSLIITKYDLKCIAICHQLIVAQWLALMATNLKVLGSSFTGVKTK